ncbi:MAG: response regulator [Rhizobiales bacterium 63-7]|nr:response regulator [Hyphomicrobiales bacterium]OJU67039.1 MAG: response regulator [Rhizobiales bacterium 63-7]
MPDRSLKNCRVLVVEDEYILAQELEIELQDAGAIVVGPVADLADAVALIQADDGIDAAILDANLGGNMVFPAAELLIEREVPIVFTTGYDASAIPSRFSKVARCDKPVSMKKIIEAIGRPPKG